MLWALGSRPMECGPKVYAGQAPAQGAQGLSSILSYIIDTKVYGESTTKVYTQSAT